MEAKVSGAGSLEMCLLISSLPGGGGGGGGGHSLNQALVSIIIKRAFRIALQRISKSQKTDISVKGRRPKAWRHHGLIGWPWIASSPLQDLRAVPIDQI